MSSVMLSPTPSTPRERLSPLWMSSMLWNDKAEPSTDSVVKKPTSLFKKTAIFIATHLKKHILKGSIDHARSIWRLNCVKARSNPQFVTNLVIVGQSTLRAKVGNWMNWMLWWYINYAYNYVLCFGNSFGAKSYNEISKGRKPVCL